MKNIINLVVNNYLSIIGSLVIVVSVIVIIFTIRYCVKLYRETKNDLEKVIYVFLGISIIFPVIIYYLDRYNIPSLFGYTQNTNSSDWVNNISNYSAVIFSTLLNAAFLVFVTMKQIKANYEDNIEINKKMNEDNVKLNNEMQRIQNLPFLRYKFTNERLEGPILGENKKWFFSNQDDSNNGSIDFTMEIENIGLNAVRKVCLEVESELLKESEHFEFCNQSNLEKNEIKKKEFIITNVDKGTYQMKVFVYYQDLLKNWYKQQIDLVLVYSSIYTPENKGFDYVDSFVVHDELKLKNEPKFR